MAGDSKSNDDKGKSGPPKSADVVEDSAPKTERGKAHLVVGEAPKKPKFGGKGLDNNAVYEARRTDDSGKPQKKGEAQEGYTGGALPDDSAEEPAYKEPEHGTRQPFGPARPKKSGFIPSIMMGVAGLYAVWLLFVIASEKPSLARLVFTWLVGAGVGFGWLVSINLPG